MDPAGSRPRPAATRVSAPERGQAEGGAGSPPSWGSRDSPPSSTSRASAAAFQSRGPPAPPHADTHNVVTGEATRTGGQLQPSSSRPTARPTAESMRVCTPQTQGPVWAVTPAINRSGDPALPRVRMLRPPGAGPASSSRPAPAREFPAFLRVMLQNRGARSRENGILGVFFPPPRGWRAGRAGRTDVAVPGAALWALGPAPFAQRTRWFC